MYNTPMTKRYTYKDKAPLNAWISKETNEYIRQFATERGYPIGIAVDKIIELHRYHTEVLSKVQLTKDPTNEATN
jgi:hypothetical protein